MEGEELQVIEDGDVEDWLKVAAFPLFFSGFRLQWSFYITVSGFLKPGVMSCILNRNNNESSFAKIRKQSNKI